MRSGGISYRCKNCTTRQIRTVAFHPVKWIDETENSRRYLLSDASITRAERDKIWVAAEDCAGGNIRFIRTYHH